MCCRQVHGILHLVIYMRKCLSHIIILDSHQKDSFQLDTSFTISIYNIYIYLYTHTCRCIYMC